MILGLQVSWNYETASEVWVLLDGKRPEMLEYQNVLQLKSRLKASCLREVQKYV